MPRYKFIIRYPFALKNTMSGHLVQEQDSPSPQAYNDDELKAAQALAELGDSTHTDSPMITLASSISPASSWTEKVENSVTTSNKQSSQSR